MGALLPSIPAVLAGTRWQCGGDCATSWRDGHSSDVAAPGENIVIPYRYRPLARRRPRWPGVRGGRMGWSQGATVTLRAVVCVPGDAHSRIGLGVRHATRSSGGWSCIVRSQRSVCDWPWVVVGRENWSNQESLERASNDDSRGEATDGFLNSSVQLKQEAQPARAKGTAKSTSLDIIRRPWRVRCEQVWDGAA